MNEEMIVDEEIEEIVLSEEEENYYTNLDAYFSTLIRSWIKEMEYYVNTKKRRIDFINYLIQKVSPGKIDHDSEFSGKIIFGKKLESFFAYHKTSWRKMIEYGIPESILKLKEVS